MSEINSVEKTAEGQQTPVTPVSGSQGNIGKKKMKLREFFEKLKEGPADTLHYGSFELDDYDVPFEDPVAELTFRYYYVYNPKEDDLSLEAMEVTHIRPIDDRIPRDFEHWQYWKNVEEGNVFLRVANQLLFLPEEHEAIAENCLDDIVENVEWSWPRRIQVSVYGSQFMEDPEEVEK